MRHSLPIQLVHDYNPELMIGLFDNNPSIDTILDGEDQRIPMVRRIYPNSLFYDIVGTQPLANYESKFVRFRTIYGTPPAYPETAVKLE